MIRNIEAKVNIPGAKKSSVEGTFTSTRDAISKRKGLRGAYKKLLLGAFS